MRLKNTTTLWIILFLLMPVSGFSGTLQQLAAKFGKDIKNTDIKIAVMDFSTGEIGKSQDSNVVRERITTFLAQNKNISLIERSLLEKVFQEQKIQVSGAVGADTAKKIGELTGANAIVSGTLSELANDEIELNARIIEVGTGKVISAGQAVFKRDWKYFAPPALIKDEKVAADSAQDYYRRGVQYHNDGKYNMALEFYSKAIKLKPDYLEAYYGRGSIYALTPSADEILGIKQEGVFKGKYDEAISDFNRVIDLKIDYTEGYFSRAMAFSAKGDYEKALLDFNKVIELTPVSTATAVDCQILFLPDSPDYIGNYLQRGAIYKAKGIAFNPDNFTPSALQRGSPDLWAAIADYNKGIERFPSCGPLYALRGDVYKALPDIELTHYMRAIADYSRAIELSTNATDNYIARGDAFYAKGDYNSAIADYTKAIGLRTAQRNTVIPPEEIPRWEDGKPINPVFSTRYIQDEDVYLNRGNAYYMKADYDKAIADFNKAIELSAPVDDLGPSGSPQAYASRGGAYLAKGEKDKALVDYTKAVELSPSYSSVYLSRGNIYRDNKEIEKALADYCKVIELDPQNAEAYFNRGLIYHNQGKSEAVADYDRVIELSPNLSYAYLNRGIIMLGTNKNEKAISDFSRVIEIDPKNSSAYRGRADAYYNLNNFDKTIEDLNMALEINPDDNLAYDRRIGAYLNKADYDRVIADCTASIKKKPNLRMNRLRANAYFSKGEYENAIKDLNALIVGKYFDTNGDDAQYVYEIMGEAYTAKKDYPNAIKAYTKALERDPRRAALLHRLRAEAYYAIGDHKRSSHDVTKALELSPSLQGEMQTLIDSLRSAGY